MTCDITRSAFKKAHGGLRRRGPLPVFLAYQRPLSKRNFHDFSHARFMPPRRVHDSVIFRW
jgi:hypothetical protein